MQAYDAAHFKISCFDGRRRKNGLKVWYLLKSNGGSYNQTSAEQFGLDSDTVVTEDFDGDGKSDVAVFRPADGNWYFSLSGTNTVKIVNYGVENDTPISTMNSLVQ